MLAPDFNKQHGQPTKKRWREAREYEEQATKNKKLCRTGLVMKCRNYGRERHNKKSCYRQSHSAGPSTGLSVRPPPTTTQPIAGPPPTVIKATTGPSTGPTPTPRPSPTARPPSTDGPAQTVAQHFAGPSKTAKTPKSRGRPNFPIRRSQK